jgi:hypothetical protein
MAYKASPIALSEYAQIPLVKAAGFIVSRPLSFRGHTALFFLSPSCRVYPPAWKPTGWKPSRKPGRSPYWPEARPHLGGLRIRVQ